MEQYKELVSRVFEENAEKIKEEGPRADRTGVGRFSIFGHQMRFDLSKGFPLVTTKKTAFRLIISELVWFIKGDTNIRFLLERNNHIWDDWAFKNYVASPDYFGPDMTDFGVRAEQDPDFKKIVDEQMKLFTDRILTDDDFAAVYGELGPVYGKQWRNWEDEHDQLAWIVKEILKNPNSSRLMLNAYNISDVMSGKMALPPCHALAQIYVADGKVSCQLYQRSADIFLGVPYNIASYAALTHVIAKLTGLEVGEFVHTFGDAHIYANHLEQMALQLEREPYPLPTLIIKTPEGNEDEEKTIEQLLDEVVDWEFILEDYQHHPAIKGSVAV